MVKKHFINDPFIKVAINVFKNVEKGLAIQTKSWPTDHIKKLRKINKVVEFIDAEPQFSLEFKLMAFKEFSNIIKIKSSGNESDNNEVFYKWIKEQGITSPEVDIVLHFPSWLGNKWMDVILPKGSLTDWPLNLLIYFLVEYGKIIYPTENHFSVLASKFNSSNFSMSGWKRYSKLNDARKRIFDRYKFVIENLNCSGLYSHISFSFDC